jgi:DNA ligase-associated metallophosphoesterase
MNGYAFTFAGQRLVARASGALWWPSRQWLIVADLHLGKSERMARRGGTLLPPYEIRATLDRLAAEIAALSPLTVVSLGDGFDDDAAAMAMPDDLRALLWTLSDRRDWIWVRGNHDPQPILPHLPGRSLPVIETDLTLRHEAGQGPDVSAHFHPCFHLAGQRHRCFLIGREHVILPAFGAYTGGLICDDPALVALVPEGVAVLCGARALPVPIGHARGKVLPRRGLPGTRFR